MENKLWINGKNFEITNSPFSSGALHYGTAVFDGLLCVCVRRNQRFIFRIQDHIDRIFYSAGKLRIRIPYTKNQITYAIKSLVTGSEAGSYYIRPILFNKSNFVDFVPNVKKEDINFLILCEKFDFWKFICLMKNCRLRMIISKTVTIAWPDALVSAKVSGKYLIYTLAKMEAVERHCHEAVILDREGRALESSSANIFIVKDRIIITPPTGRILPGITRATVFDIAKTLNYKVEEKEIYTADLLGADEIFLTNTARGISLISQIESKKLTIPKNESLSRHIQNKYLDIISGKEDLYLNWLTLADG